MQSSILPPPALEQGIRPLSRPPSPLPIHSSSPYPRLHLMLCLAMEKESHAALLESLPLLSHDALRRDISLISRTEARQISFLSASLGEQENPEVSAFFHSLLCLELSAALAQRMGECSLRRLLDFYLPEYLDEVYRLSNLLYLHGMESPQSLAGCCAEIMPGRPLSACHRHPFDCVSAPLSPSDAWQALALNLVSAAEREKGAFLLYASRQADPSLSRGLFSEMYMLSQQRRTRFLSLRPSHPPIRFLLSCQHAEAYAYQSFLALAETPEVQGPVQQEADNESAHLQKLNRWLSREDAGDDSPPALPPPLCLGPSKGYVRDTLQSIGETALREDFVPVGSLPRGADFFRYQKRVCPPGDTLPSQRVVQAVIQKFGMDYRFEIAPHPVEMLRNRSCDHSDLGR